MLAKLERIDNISADKAGGNFRLNNVARAGSNVLTVEDLSIGYEGRPLAANIDFTLHRGEALGIIGGNGTGKTTFLKTILGDLREIGGDIRWGTKTDIGYYAQNLEDLDARNEVLQELRRVAPLVESGALRGFLAGFLFTGEDVFKRVADLSGGEKGRLALAKLIYSQKNVLILDEPTNHLDIPSREALENALDEYPGTIITVSHDRFFLDKIATQILSFEPNGKIETFNGNYSEFHEWKVSNAGRSERPAGNAAEGASERTGPSGSGLSKNQVQRIEGRIKEIEEELPVLEEQLSRLSMDMGDPEIAADAGALNDITIRYGKVENDIKARYAEWEELLEKLR
jgi:ATP-binding cassette subfamily F protein 3